MTVKNPYEPPSYGVRNLAIERRVAGKPPASVEDDDEAEEAEVSVKAEKPVANKARKAAPANKGKK